MYMCRIVKTYEVDIKEQLKHALDWCLSDEDCDTVCHDRVLKLEARLI